MTAYINFEKNGSISYLIGHNFNSMGLPVVSIQADGNELRYFRQLMGNTPLFNKEDGQSEMVTYTGWRCQALIEALEEDCRKLAITLERINVVKELLYELSDTEQELLAQQLVKEDKPIVDMIRKYL